MVVRHRCREATSLIEKNKDKEGGEKMRKRRNRFAAEERKKLFDLIGCLHVHVDAYYNEVLLEENNVAARVVKLFN